MSDVIALIFDFDDTLAPDSTSGFLDSLGVDTQQFWTKRVDPLLAQDWDPVPAYLHEMIALSREGQHGAITQDKLQEWGKSLPLHAGVQSLFSRLRAQLNYWQWSKQRPLYFQQLLTDRVRAQDVRQSYGLRSQ